MADINCKRCGEPVTDGDDVVHFTPNHGMFLEYSAGWTVVDIPQEEETRVTLTNPMMYHADCLRP